MTTMWIPTPCSENLDEMPRDAEGNARCTKCERSVVDLRSVRRKRALAVIAGLRSHGDGKVCIRANVRADGTPVFAPDPSPLARFVGPIALVSSLAACAPEASHVDRGTTPVAHVLEQHENTNGTPPVTTTTVSTPVQPATGYRNVNNTPVPDITTAVAGGLAFAD